jgi:hypothetical protein
MERPKSQGANQIYTISEQLDPAITKLLVSLAWKDFLSKLTAAQKFYEKRVKTEDQDGSSKGQLKQELVDPNTLRIIDNFVDKCIKQK